MKFFFVWGAFSRRGFVPCVDLKGSVVSLNLDLDSKRIIATCGAASSGAVLTRSGEAVALVDRVTGYSVVGTKRAGEGEEGELGDEGGVRLDLGRRWSRGEGSGGMTRGG